MGRPTTQEILVKIKAIVEGLNSVKELVSAGKQLQAQGGKKVGLDTSDAQKGSARLTGFLRELFPAFDRVADRAEGLTKSLGVSGGLASVLNPVALGLVAVGAALTTVVGVLFKAVTGFEEYGSHIREIQEETGLAAETLSTLDAASILAGKDINALAPAFAVYLRNVSAAAHGNDEMEERFRRFGINAKEAVKNPDEAIKQLLATLAKYPAGAERLDVANQLAGKSGRALARIVEEMGGDFQRFQDEARRWGVVLGETDVQAADRFGDAVTVMGFKVRGILFGIARGALPELQKALDDTSGDVAAGGRSWEQFGRDAGKWIREAIAEVKKLDAELTRVSDFLDDISGGINPFTRPRYESRRRGEGDPSGPGQRFGGMVNSPDQLPATSTAGAGATLPDEEDARWKAAQIAEQAAAQSLLAAQTAAETAFRQAVAAAHEAFRVSGDYVEFIGSMKKAEADRWAAREAQLAAERQAIQKAVQDEQLTLAQLRTNLAQEKQARAEFTLRMAELDRQRIEKSLAALQREHRDALELYDLQADEYIRRQNELAEAGQISHRTAQQHINEETARGFNKRREFLELEKEAAKGSAEAYAEVTQRLRVLTEQAQQFARHAGVDVTSATIRDLQRLLDRASEVVTNIERVVVGVVVPQPQGDGPRVDPRDAGEAPSGEELDAAATWERRWREAVLNVERLFSDFFLDLQQGFGFALRNMLAGFLQMVARAAAAKIVKALLGTSSEDDEGEGGGSGAGLIGFVGSFLGSIFRAEGGPVHGAGTSTSDSILARLSNGEYVIRAWAVKMVGPDVLDFINRLGRLPSLTAPAFAFGGLVSDDFNERLLSSVSPVDAHSKFTSADLQRVERPDPAAFGQQAAPVVRVHQEIKTPNIQSFRASEASLRNDLLRFLQRGLRPRR